MPRTRSLPIAAGLALLTAACGGGAEPDPFLLDRETPVVVVLIDTLRADHLPFYGYELDTSPFLAELAAKSYLFEANSTQCNTTFPSITSIFTGVYPKTHRNYLAVPIEGTVVSSPLRCAAETFRELGHRTLAATSHPSWAAQRDEDAVLWKGWDAISHLGEPIPLGERELYARASYTNERLFGLLDEYDGAYGSRPLFLWAHYFDPHTDLYGNLYDPPEELRNRFLDHHLAKLGLEEHADALRPLDPAARHQWIQQEAPQDLRKALKLAAGRAGYDAEILSCDGGIRELFARLETSGVLDEAVVVVLADHGENMEELSEEREAAAFTHKRLYEGVAHTPLLIHLPGQTEGRRIGAITQNIDVLPTLMELFDLPRDERIEGESLVPLMRGTQEQVHDLVYMESSVGSEKAVRSKRFKLIDGWQPEEQELYDWLEDPGEERNLSSELGERTSILSERLEAFRPRVEWRIQCVPMAEPYDLDLRLRMPSARIERVEGVDASCVSEDRHEFRWRGEVGPDGLDVVLHPQIFKKWQEVHWWVRHGGRDDLPQAVMLGKTPVGRTPAIPVWATDAKVTLGGASYRIDEDDAAGITRIAIEHPGAQKIECEVRYLEGRATKHLEVVRAEGFEERQPPIASFHRSDAYGVDRASLELRLTHPEEERRYLLRVDGVWPDARRLSVNGEGVDTSTLHFVFPALPKDKRIQPYVSAGPGPDTELAPGSIVIWQQSGAEGGEIDAGGLTREQAQQLNNIGYLDSGEGESDEEDDDEEEQ